MWLRHRITNDSLGTVKECCLYSRQMQNKNTLHPRLLTVGVLSCSLFLIGGSGGGRWTSYMPMLVLTFCGSTVFKSCEQRIFIKSEFFFSLLLSFCGDLFLHLVVNVNPDNRCVWWLVCPLVAWLESEACSMQDSVRQAGMRLGLPPSCIPCEQMTDTSLL